jgi:DNA-binding transcriptional LysR family regulator
MAFASLRARRIRPYRDQLAADVSDSDPRSRREREVSEGGDEHSTDEKSGGCLDHDASEGEHHDGDLHELEDHETSELSPETLPTRDELRHDDLLESERRRRRRPTVERFDDDTVRRAGQCDTRAPMRASPDDILGMAYFARVVEARSFSDAARALGVSKSAVSARVAKLEERLGVQLLHRTTRRLALTADGVRLYERCARVVAEADEAAEIGAGAAAVPRGTLRLSAPPGLALSHLTRVVADFMRAFPTVRVDLRSSDHLPDPTMDQHDVAVVVAPRLADSGLTTRKLATLRMTVCAAPEYLRRKGIPFRPQDLVLHDCIAHIIRQGTDDLRFETDEGAVSMASLAKLLVDDTRILREAALAGLGIIMIPEVLIADDLAARRLQRVLEDFETIEHGVHVLHPHGRLPPAIVRAFLEHLTASFRGPAWTAERAAPPAVGARSKKGTVPMTDQDVRRLTAVAALYEDIDREGADALRAILAKAKPMPAAKVPRTVVTMNSRLRVRGREGEREVSLVYPWDAGADRISVLSAAGRELLGASIGKSVTVISYQPEAAGDHHL